MPPDPRVLPARRWVVLTALLLVVVGACAALGAWQWQRGHVVVSDPPAARPVTALDAVVTTSDPLTAEEVGRRVRVVGEWDPQVRLELPGRPLGGADGSWVLGLVRTPDGSGVPVVRGWVPSGAQPAPAEGAADLVAVLQAPEAQDQAAGSGPLPPGRAWVVSPAMLVNEVDYPVVPAYGVAVEAGAGLRAVPPPDPGAAGRRLDWRNLGYAAQWWVFAGFAVVVWVRALRDDLHAAAPGPDEPPGGPDGPDGPPSGPARPDDPRTTTHDGSPRLLEERTR